MISFVNLMAAEMAPDALQFRDAERKCCALDASTTEFTAPADVPLMTGNGLALSRGRSSARAFRTPT